MGKLIWFVFYAFIASSLAFLYLKVSQRDCSYYADSQTLVFNSYPDNPFWCRSALEEFQKRFGHDQEQR
jgi:hypothetical protein